MRHAHHAAGLILAPVLAVALAGCGGSDKPDATRSASATPSASPTSESASPSASASASAPPLSRFEDLGPVKGARAWEVAYARDINDQDANLTRLKKLSTPSATLQDYTAEDIRLKEIYPGPNPFTPVRIVRSGSVVKVVTCERLGGWALDRNTKQPHSAVKIAGVDYSMTKVGGVWKLAAYTLDTGVNCSGVTVKGVPFPPA